jgi:hypothetical protein
MIPMSELFDELPEPQETWEQKAKAYIKEHPASIDWMMRKALEIKSDFGWCNMKNVADEFRRSGPSDGKKSKYKWNNNYTTYVGDYLMEHCARLQGCFITRKRSPKTRKVLA